MQRPDLILTHIKHAAYPVWMAWLIKYRDRFNKVIIYFSEHNRFPYFDHYIQTVLKDQDVIFLDPVLTDWSAEDWRNKSTNEMLKYSDSEWVCSIEQDWFSNNWGLLFELVEDCMKESDLFGWMNPTSNPYIHPAFFFCKRELLEKTGKDFSPHSEIVGSDHFAMITYKAKEFGAKIGELNVGEVRPGSLAYHLGGVNQNFLDGINNKYFHRPDIFYVYNYWCRKANVIQSPLFTEISLKVEEYLKLPIDPETSPWREYFIC